MERHAVEFDLMSYFPAFNPRYGSFVDVTDQTGSTATPTAVKFGTNLINTAGVTVVTDGSQLTRLTFAEAGTYVVTSNAQCSNSDAADHNVTVWMRLNGSDVTNTTFRQVIPKVGDGGVGFISVGTVAAFAAGDYIQIMWLVDNTALTLDAAAAVVGPPAYPARASARIQAHRIAA